MASLRRNKALLPDGQTAKFLYTILKQLDLKAIDWNVVAGSLEITNGHAARMRFSRFKQHMEGMPAQPRAPRQKKEGGTTGKKTKRQGIKRGHDDDSQGEDLKGGDLKGEGFKDENGDAYDTKVKVEGQRIKEEPGLREQSNDNGEPELKKVKQEPGLEKSSWQSMNNTPAPSTEHSHKGDLVSSTITPSVLRPTSPLRTSSVVQKAMLAPPVATVSMADLDLPRNYGLSSCHSENPIQGYGIGVPSPVPLPEMSKPRIKIEPIVDDSHGIPSVLPATVKSEPLDL